MADFGRGIKAGAAAAAIYLVVSIIISAIISAIFRLTGISCESSLVAAAGLNFPLESTDRLLLTGSIFGRIVQGVIFGAVFAALYNLLPSTGAIRKALVFSSLLWVLVAAELVYTTVPAVLAYTPADASWSTALTVAGVHVSLPLVSGTLAGFISALAFGALVGFLWGKFRGTRLTAAGKNNGVLLVAFTLGLYLWLSPVVGVIIYLINKGTIVMNPGPLWWSNILGLVTAFLGTLGWVLALIAWLRTRRGRSAFKWGLAGGVIMVGTGLMLVPGVIAITGGVLSRHKPTTESSTTAIGERIVR